MNSLIQFWEKEDSSAKKTENQRQRYQRLQAKPEIMRIIEMGGGNAMGTAMERYARFHFSALYKRAEKSKDTNSTGHDQRITVSGVEKKLEQKSSGLWGDGDTFRWQHLEVKHKWDGLLLVGIYPDRIVFWGMTRAAFMKCVEDGTVTNQGNQQKDSTEGMWMVYKDIKDSLVELKTNEELLAFAATC
jgi:hypothetical protein